MLKINEKIRRHLGKLLIGLILLLACAWFIYTHFESLSLEEIIAFSERIPTGWIIAAFFFLPLAGFPISILLLLAGIRFGFLTGALITIAGISFHNYAAYHLTHGWFRNPVMQYLNRFGYAIPSVGEKHRVWFTAAFTAIHGPPYIAKLYLLALTDIPFKIYFWIGTSVYTLFALIPVAAGSAVVQFNTKWLYLFISISIVSIFIGLWIRNRSSSDK